MSRARHLPAAFVLLSAWPASAEPLAELLASPPSVPPGFLDGRPRVVPAGDIISAAPSATELLFALGAGGRVRGVTRYDDFPPEVRALPRVGGFTDLDVEAILAARPALLVAAPNAAIRPTLERLSALGVPVFIAPANGLSDLFHGARALGQVLGPEAEKRAAELSAEISAGLRSLARPPAARPARVAFVYGRAPLVLAGPGSFADSLLTLLGAQNVVRRGPAYPQYALEQLLADAPEVLLDASAPHEGAAPAPWDRYGTLPAVKNRRVHPVLFAELLRPGPRILQGMAELSRLLYPP